ncbi:hypothetical protein Tco_0385887 [Tanacetum coccineum]
MQKNQAENKDLNGESEGENDEDEIHLAIESENEEIITEKTQKAKKYRKKIKKAEEEKHMGSYEEDVMRVRMKGYLQNTRHRPTLRSWNTPMMKQRIMMKTTKRCLGNLKYHDEFDLEEEQTGLDLYKGFDVYIEPLNDRKPVTKEEYKQVFNNVDFNLDDSFMDEYSDSNSDSDNDDNNNNDEDEAPIKDENPTGNEKNKNKNEKESDNENEKETRDDFVEKVIEENNEATFSMEVDDQNEENMKEKEHDKEKVNEKEGNEKEGNEKEGNDIMNKNEMNNDALKTKQQVETEKEKEAKIEKVEHNQGNNDQGYDHLTQDRFWEKEFSEEIFDKLVTQVEKDF